jgi:phage major head subunit gpT-like protein
MAFQTNWNQNLLEPGIRYYFMLGRKAAMGEAIYTRLLNTENSEKAKETMRSYANLGPMVGMSHGGTIPADTMLDGFPMIFQHVKYGKIIGIDAESIADDQYGIVKKMAGLLPRSVQVTKEILGHTPYNNAFTTNLSDGVPLIANNHPLIKAGGTASNILPTAFDPSYSCFSALATMLQTQRDAAGQPLMYADQQKIWLVHPDFYAPAIQAVDSTSTAIVEGSGTANANSALVNPWKGKTTVISSPYLTDNDASFMIVVGGHEGYFFTRSESGTPETWMERNPEVQYSKVTGRYSMGFADWRGIAGSAGAV